ncbi:MAG: DUF2784 domain-containing protein [Nitrospirota bacterium]|nr:DUF2784 domain-containing protein [Nitrospirota bacterium]MDH5775991.1 DUF2784 domain-containing protein [Nitrospirota bacterium]
MVGRIIADCLVLIHLVFICFVVLGGLLVMRWKWVSLFHLPAVAWGALIEFQGWICPLTPLEHHFRHLAGQSGYSGSFIEHYLIPLIYPSGLTRPIQIVIGAFVIIMNMIIYGHWLYRTKHPRS